MMIGLGFGLGRRVGFASNALSRVQAAAPDFTAWWTSADPTSMLLAANGVGGFVSASGQTVGGWLNVKDCGSKTFAQCLAAQPELVTNGTFDTDVSGWTTNNANASVTWVSGGKMLFASESFAYAKTPISLGPTNSRFLVTFTITDRTGALANLHVGIGASGNTVSGNGTFSYIYTGSGDTEFQIRPNSGGTGSLVIDDISIKALPALPLLQSDSAREPQYLLSGGIGSLNMDGVTDFLSTGTLASALPSDCAVYLAIKANPADTQYVLMSSSAPDCFYGVVVDSDGGSVTGGAGTPSFELDAAGNVWAGTRDTLHNDLADDAGHIFVGRNVNLSNFPDLYFGVWGYNISTYLFTGAYRDILIVPESVLTANPTLHADIMAMLAARYPS